MDSPSRLHTAIYWTRTTVLVTSMLIFILALTNYSRSTLPIATLLSKDDPHQLLLALIEDRRLITTLVAAQASIFCPLILLGIPQEKTILDRLCQCLIPLGPGLGWLYCILFNQRTSTLGSFFNLTGMASVVIVALGLEMILTGLAWMDDHQKSKRSPPLLLL
jgi:hypothetical protein